MSRRYWTEERIISEIQKLHKDGEDLWYRAMERNHKDLIRASERYYKGWKNAVEAAGLEYDTIKKRTHQVWTEESIMAELDKLSTEVEQLRAGKVQQINKKLYLAIIRQYRSFNAAMTRLREYKNDGHKTQNSATKVKSKQEADTREPPKDDSTPSLVEPAGDMKIFTVRTRIRSERNVGEAIEKRAANKGVNIGTIQYPTALNGYIFVECDNRDKLNRLIKNIKNAQGLLSGETTSDEISKYIKTRKSSRKNVFEGSHVEITEGQFKGEEAVIQHINERTRELTVELVDEVLKIPIIIYKEQCRIVK
jgi:transcription elongation factor Spt5